MNSVCQLLQRINFKISPSNIHLNNKKLIPVTRGKLDDLQSLKEAIPTDFHSYYNNLPRNNVTQNYRNVFIELQYIAHAYTVNNRTLYKLNKASFKNTYIH